jgi:hypothetical protein
MKAWSIVTGRTSSQACESLAWIKKLSKRINFIQVNIAGPGIISHSATKQNTN